MDERGEKPAYWAVLPATVRYDTVIPPNAKLLYAEISALCGQSGVCSASNDYFSALFEMTERTIQRLIRSLETRGYISVRYVPPDESNKSGRLILGGLNPAAQLPPEQGGDKNVTHDNFVTQSIREEEVVDYNTPLKSPQGGRASGKRAHRTEPEWRPDRFSGFWRFYPRHEAKQKAIAAWDKLRPSDELISVMGRALVALKATEDWKRGIGIPYASTWLNGARWEDAEDAADWRDAYSGTVPQGWADDPEVI